MNIEDEYEAMTVCGDASGKYPYTDNMHGNCDGCGKEIVWRPHSPHGRRVFMACVDCAMEAMVEMGKRGEKSEIVATPQTLSELETILAAAKK